MAQVKKESRREERRQQHFGLSRLQLLDAAEELFGKRGFHETALREVAELAEFSVGSVYSFFESKDDLFRQIFIRRGEEFMPAIRDTLAGTGTPSELLHDLIDFEVGFFRRRPHFGRLFLRYPSPAMLSADHQLYETIAANHDEALRLEAELFARGQRSGDFRPGDPMAFARLFSGLVSAYHALDPAVVSDEPTSSDPLPVAELHALIGRAFVA